MVGSNDPCSQTLNLAVSKIKADAQKSSQVRNVGNEEMKRKKQNKTKPRTKNQNQTKTNNNKLKTQNPCFHFTVYVLQIPVA